MLALAACGGGQPDSATIDLTERGSTPEQQQLDQSREHAMIERHDANPGGSSDIWFWMYVMSASRPWPYPAYVPTYTTPPRTDYTPRAAPPASVPRAVPVAPKAAPVAPRVAPAAPKVAPAAPRVAPVAPRAPSIGKCDLAMDFPLWLVEAHTHE